MELSKEVSSLLDIPLFSEQERVLELVRSFRPTFPKKLGPVGEKSLQLAKEYFQTSCYRTDIRLVYLSDSLFIISKTYFR